MRFCLTLTNERKEVLPLNYQYPLSAWIYNVLKKADPQFTRWLHEHGYQYSKNRIFKLFVFSNLMLSKAKLIKDRPYLEVAPGMHRFYMSFCIMEAAEHFIRGLFTDQRIQIGDRYQRADFQVSSVERIADPPLKGEAEFKCLSPIVVSRPEFRKDKLQGTYLGPKAPDYSERLRDNLVKKYLTVYYGAQAVSKEGNKDIATGDLPFNPGKWEFECLGSARSRLQTFKAGQPGETRVRGFVFRFRVKAPAEMIKVGYEAGFGEKGSLGFGCAGTETF